MNNIRHNHPSPIQCLRVFPTGPCYVTLPLLLSLLLLLLCCYCCYFAATAVTLLLLVTIATTTITLPCYWYFVADTKSFRCGWIDNSTANTWEYSLASPWVESINLGWILYPRKLLRSPILVGYQDLFLTLLPGKHSLFSESLGIYVCWSLWGIR